MFGISIVRTSTLDNLRTRIASLEDCRQLLLRDIQSREEEIVSITVELNETKTKLEKIKAEHDVLVGLCYDPTSSEAQRAGGFSVSVPDATGHSD